MIPIPKEGHNEKANNNRPISLLPILSKICEKTVHNQLCSYLKVKGRLTKLKALTLHSTETSLIETTATILKTIDKKMLTAAVFLDMIKAFDNVNHEMLILRLQDIGASSSTLSCFVTTLAT